jgi:putative PIN family toxin of toxin-antitoxin system
MVKRYKLILDTNIFIDAINGDENAIAILALVDNGIAKLYFSRNIIGELFYILHNICKYEIKNMKKSKNIMTNITNMYLKSTNINTKNSDGSPKSKDIDDDMFLECAFIANPDYLISNDIKSGMHNIKFEKTKIVTASEFINIVTN